MKLGRSIASLATVTMLSIAAPAYAATSLATFAYSGGFATTLLLNGTTTLTATSRGWVEDSGSNNGGGAGANYIAGLCGSSDACSGADNFYNNYFVFSLASFTGGAITSAVLQLTQGPTGYISSTPSLTYSLWDSSVAPGSMSSASGLAYYNDLASGVSFGSVVVTAASNNTVVGIGINAAGLAALNAARGASFGFGGTVNAVVSPIPEPATWAMMLSGFGLVGGAMRYRRRTMRVSYSA